jgi:hypothetical protein
VAWQEVQNFGKKNTPSQKTWSKSIVNMNKAAILLFCGLPKSIA